MLISEIPSPASFSLQNLDNKRANLPDPSQNIPFRGVAGKICNLLELNQGSSYSYFCKQVYLLITRGYQLPSTKDEEDPEGPSGSAALSKSVRGQRLAKGNWNSSRYTPSNSSMTDWVGEMRQGRGWNIRLRASELKRGGGGDGLTAAEGGLCENSPRTGRGRGDASF